MNSGARREVIVAVLAVMLSLGLVGMLVHINRDPPPVNLRDPSPGFGWSWSFDHRQALPAEGAAPRHLDTDTPSAKSEPRPADLELVLGQPLTVNGVTLVYRGKIDGGRFRVDTIIPALDPDYHYVNEIQAAEARKGFSLAGRRFILKDIGRSRLKLTMPGR